jgi:outer membrane translocation and assembly module TamA
LPLVRSGAIAVNTRAGAQYVFGDYPFFDAAFLGGIHNVRGFSQWRFAGDGMAYGGADLVARIGHLPLLLNWRLSGFAFVDGGRVFLAGEDSDKWHSAPGVGVTFDALTYTVRVSYAFGPTGRIYLEMGNPF